jgi:hypothetical protein
MYAPIEKMPDDSRIWIYQSDRKLTVLEEEKITSLAKEFVDSWTAHNQELKASFEIRYGIFLIIMIDSKHALASGCSIDKSVHFIQRIEKDFAISLLDRQIFALRDDNEIRLVRRKEFERMIEKEISPDTIVFNNLIQTKRELETKWEIPIRESWHGAINTIRG